MRLAAGFLLLCLSCSATEGLVLESAPDAVSSLSVDASVDGRPSGPDMSAELVACAHDCVVAAKAGDGCPDLLLYGCLQPACGAGAVGDICEEPNGEPPMVSTIVCAQSALATCGNDTCQNRDYCLAFVACIQAC